MNNRINKLLLLFIFSIFSTFLFSLSFSGFDSDFLVILFEGSQIFSGFREFSFFHTFSDVPMYEGSLGIHQIEFVVQSGEDFGNGGRVGDHADGSHDFGQITSGDDGGGLIVDSDFESSGAPVDELDGSLGFNGGNGSIDVFGDNVSSVHHGASHIFSVSRVTFSHHVGGFEGRVGDFGNGQLFVVGLFSRDDGGIR